MIQRSTRRKASTPLLDHRTFIRPPATLHATTAELAQAWLEVRAQARLHTTTEEAAWRLTIAPAFGDLPVRELEPRAIEAWIRSLVASGYNPNTVRSRYSMFRAMLEWGVGEGFLDLNPAAAVRKAELPPKLYTARSEAEVLSLEQVHRVVYSTLPIGRRVLWAAALLAGARFGELAALTWADLELGVEPLGRMTITRSWDCKRHEVRPTTKERQVKRVPVHPALRNVLFEWRGRLRELLGRAVDGADLVLPRPPVRHFEGTVAWAETSALRAWRQDLLALGIEHPSEGPRRLHGARHTFISRALEGGADPRHVRHLTHREAPRSAFDRYSHVSWEGCCRAVLAIELQPPAEAFRPRYTPPNPPGRGKRAGGREARELRRDGLVVGHEPAEEEV